MYRAMHGINACFIYLSLEKTYFLSVICVRVIDLEDLILENQFIFQWGYADSQETADVEHKLIVFERLILCTPMYS